MSQEIRLAVLGGSGVATPELIDSLAQRKQRPAFHVALIGRSAGKLERVAAACRRMAEGAEPALTVSVHTDLGEGLSGVDFILNQVRVGGFEGRAFDETFPRAFGIPGEETFGPGGMNLALRTIPVVLEMCRIIEKAAPGALLLNLTNPSSFIQYAVSKYTQVKVIGVCDSPIGLAEGVAALLGCDLKELTIRYTGMHHFGWVTGVEWRGRDVMPDILEKAVEIPGLPVDVEIVRAVRAIPTSYYKYYYHSDRALAAQQGKPPRAEQLMALEAQILAAYAGENLTQKPDSLVQRSARWYERIVVPVLIALALDSRETFILNVTNDHALPFLPPEAIVEVPCLVRYKKALPLAYDGGLPRDLQAMLETNAAFEMLWVEAVVERSYDKALRAMMLNHLVASYDQARAILEKIWL